MEKIMRPHVVRGAVALVLVGAATSFGAPSRADPLITQGIGISSWRKLASDLKPSAASITSPTT
jgi:hypothetical protein